jgi:hypothetical protein
MVRWLASLKPHLSAGALPNKIMAIHLGEQRLPEGADGKRYPLLPRERVAAGVPSE